MAQTNIQKPDSHLSGFHTMTAYSSSRPPPAMLFMRRYLSSLKEFERLRDNIPFQHILVLTYVAGHPDCLEEEIMKTLSITQQTVNRVLNTYGGWEGAKDVTTGEKGIGILERCVDNYNSKIKRYSLAPKGIRVFSGIEKAMAES